MPPAKGIPGRSLRRRAVLKLGLLGLFATALPPPAAARRFILPPDDVTLVGAVQVFIAPKETTLLDIARRFNLGFNEIRLANPDIDPWLVKPGVKVTLPLRFVLPDARREGIVLNVPEMRIYYYPRRRQGNRPLVITHPVSIGRGDWETPLGQTKVVAKKKDPEWRPPESIRAEHAAKGEPLPKVVPAGPDNPLGQYALRLGFPGYLIHGTNKPYGIGMRVSHGCVRMYPEDIASLFHDIPVGEPVNIIHQPYKFGFFAGELYLEAHPPFADEYAGMPSAQRLMKAVAKVNGKLPVWQQVDIQDAMRIARDPSGIPRPVRVIERRAPPGPGYWMPPSSRRRSH